MQGCELLSRASWAGAPSLRCDGTCGRGRGVTGGECHRVCLSYLYFLSCALPLQLTWPVCLLGGFQGLVGILVYQGIAARAVRSGFFRCAGSLRRFCWVCPADTRL